MPTTTSVAVVGAAIVVAGGAVAAAAAVELVEQNYCSLPTVIDASAAALFVAARRVGTYRIVYGH